MRSDMAVLGVLSDFKQDPGIVSIFKRRGAKWHVEFVLGAGWPGAVASPRQSCVSTVVSAYGEGRVHGNGRQGGAKSTLQASGRSA